MPQSQPTANPRYQEEEKKDKNQYVQNIFFFFQHIKMSKAFTLEKSQKKKMLFVYGMYARLFYCLWHMRNQFTVYSELQPYLTGPNHSYTRQVKCPLIGDLIVVLYVVCTHH